MHSEINEEYNRDTPQQSQYTQYYHTVGYPEHNIQLLMIAQYYMHAHVQQHLIHFMTHLCT